MTADATDATLEPQGAPPSTAALREVELRSTPQTSAGLAITGFLMLGTLFLIANPEMGLGFKVWPWQLFAQTSDNLTRATMLLWALTAGCALTLGFSHMRRQRATLLLTLFAVLLPACCTVEAGLTVQHWNFHQLLVMILLGAGLLLCALDDAPRAGRRIAAAGGFLMLWVIAFSDEPQTGRSQMQLVWNDLQTLFSGEELQPEVTNHLWWTLIPRLAFITSAVLAIGAGLGLATRWTGWIGFGLLFGALIMPFFLNTLLRAERGVTTTETLGYVLDVFRANGLLLWMLGIFTLRDAFAREVSA